MLTATAHPVLGLWRFPPHTAGLPTQPPVSAAFSTLFTSIDQSPLFLFQANCCDWIAGLLIYWEIVWVFILYIEPCMVTCGHAVVHKNFLCRCSISLLRYCTVQLKYSPLTLSLHRTRQSTKKFTPDMTASAGQLCQPCLYAVNTFTAYRQG